jgi:hypothetical protein
MSRVGRSERVDDIRMVVMFRGLSKIGSKYAIVCEYPKNEFVAVGDPRIAPRIATRFNVNEYQNMLESERVREFDTLIFSALITHDRYGVVDASDIKIMNCIRNSPVD